MQKEDLLTDITFDPLLILAGLHLKFQENWFQHLRIINISFDVSN
jgi:hypothetical protein